MPAAAGRGGWARSSAGMGGGAFREAGHALWVVLRLYRDPCQSLEDALPQLGREPTGSWDLCPSLRSSLPLSACPPASSSNCQPPTACQWWAETHPTHHNVVPAAVAVPVGEVGPHPALNVHQPARHSKQQGLGWPSTPWRLAWHRERASPAPCRPSHAGPGGNPLTVPLLLHPCRWPASHVGAPVVAVRNRASVEEWEVV